VHQSASSTCSITNVPVKTADGAAVPLVIVGQVEVKGKRGEERGACDLVGESV
jgi:hypothetical protein